jgi:hypothetical protein
MQAGTYAMKNILDYHYDCSKSGIIGRSTLLGTTEETTTAHCSTRIKALIT